MLTNAGYRALIELDSIRAIRLFLKLMQLSNSYSNVTVTQVELAKMLNLKNKANVNIAINLLIEKNFISKSCNNKQITYYINPDFFVTQVGYSVAREEYTKSKEEYNLNTLLKAFKEPREELNV